MFHVGCLKFPTQLVSPLPQSILINTLYYNILPRYNYVIKFCGQSWIPEFDNICTSFPVGGAVAASGGGAAAGGGGAAAEEKEEEKKEEKEESEESDDDMGFGLFDWGTRDSTHWLVFMVYKCVVISGQQCSIWQLKSWMNIIIWQKNVKVSSRWL